MEIDINKLLKPLSESPESEWPVMKLEVQVYWHGAEPDVGIFGPTPEDVEHTFTSGGVQFGDGVWSRITEVISHMTGIEEHKIDTVLGANIEEEMEKLDPDV